MTDAALWSAFLALCGGALYFAWPRPPAWDPATFHHLVLANLHGGELEKVGGTLEAWKARCSAALPRGPRPPAAGWTGDPALLGPDYDPAVRVGAACTWLALGEATPAALEAVERRLADVRVAWVGPVVVELPHVVNREVADLAGALALVDARHQRLVLATGGDATPVLRALAAAPGLRDRLRAVLLVGARLDEAFVRDELRHEAFDTEMAQRIPWITLRDEGVPPLVEPPPPASQRAPIEVVDLGVRVAGVPADPHAARALAVLLAALG